MNKINQETLAVKRAEQLFDRRRRTVGLFGGPLLALLVFFTPIDGLTLEAHKLLFIMVLVAIWWITEPVSIPVTSLIGPTLAVMTGVVPVSMAFAAFANPMIFLFMGGFILASAVGSYLPFVNDFVPSLVQLAYLLLGMAMAALGLNVNFGVILEKGVRPMLGAILCSFVIMGLAISIVHMFF